MNIRASEKGLRCCRRVSRESLRRENSRDLPVKRGLLGGRVQLKEQGRTLQGLGLEVKSRELQWVVECERDFWERNLVVSALLYNQTGNDLKVVQEGLRTEPRRWIDQRLCLFGIWVRLLLSWMETELERWLAGRLGWGDGTICIVGVVRAIELNCKLHLMDTPSSQGVRQHHSSSTYGLGHGSCRLL